MAIFNAKQPKLSKTVKQIPIETNLQTFYMT